MIIIIFFINIFMFLIFFGNGMLKGMDPKEIKSWIIGFHAFLTGLSIYFLRPDILLGLQAGLIISIVVMYTGIMNHRHRQRFKKY